MNTDLSSLKRDLDRTVSAVTHYVFANADLKAKHLVNGYFSGPCDDARYFHAQANNSKGFEKHVAAMIKAEPSLAAKDSPFLTLVVAAANLYLKVEKAVAAEKARLTAKRADLAARKAQKAELGVDLKKIEHATPATYKTLRASLEPVRVSVEAHYVEVLTERGAQLEQILADRGGYRHAFTVKVEGKRDRLMLPEDFYFFFEMVDDVATMHRNQKARIATKAHDRAVAETDAFAGKLAGKIDRDANGAALISAEVTGRSLWNNSTLLARLQYDVVQVWETQVIWNRSCLGLSFNQWPTRRVDAAAKGGAS